MSEELSVFYGDGLPESPGEPEGGNVTSEENEAPGPLYVPPSDWDVNAAEPGEGIGVVGDFPGIPDPMPFEVHVPPPMGDGS